MAIIYTRDEIEHKFDDSQNNLVLQASDFSLQGLKEMVDDDIIDLRPKYQRRERWEVERQSELIESFLMNVPVPPIYLAEEDCGVYSIIDGKQRITAVSEYMNNAFALKNLESFKEIEGLRFRDLPKTLQSALRIRPYLRVITLLKQSDPQLKYEVFIRLNRGGIQLNAQEIRNVAFRGPLNDLIYSCSENKLLRSALKIEGPQSAAFKQMQDAEFVLRFLTLHQVWKVFSGNFTKSMDAFMLKNRNADQQAISKLGASFHTAIERTSLLWGEMAFQRWDGEKWRQQALAGLFDAQMISAISLTPEQVAHASSKRPKIIEATKGLFDNKIFEEAVRLGTNTPARLRLRIQAVSGMLNQIQ